MTHVWQKPGAQQRHWSRTLAVPALLAALWTAGLAHAQLAIRAVSVSTQAGSEVVRIETSEPLAQLPAGFVIQQPARIALDFAGATNPLALGQIALDQRAGVATPIGSSVVSRRLTSSTSETCSVPAACCNSRRLCRKLYLDCA